MSNTRPAYGVVTLCAVGAFAFALPVGVAGADDQLQRIGQRQACGVAGLLGDGASLASASGFQFGSLMLPVQFR
jgi:hypothetical protein